MNTGMRIGELCALKWKDIDLDQKIIYIIVRFKEYILRKRIK